MGPRIAVSARLEESIEALLVDGLTDSEQLSQLGRLGAQLILLRGSLARFVSSVIPDTRAIVRTRPLEALIIGAYVRGLSDRDIESLAREAGLGAISRSSVSRLCHELRRSAITFVDDLGYCLIRQ